MSKKSLGDKASGEASSLQGGDIADGSSTGKSAPRQRRAATTAALERLENNKRKRFDVEFEDENDDDDNSSVELSEKKKQISKKSVGRTTSLLSSVSNLDKSQDTGVEKVGLLKKRSSRLGDPEWEAALWAEERVASVTKAIDRVYDMSLDTDNFELFGNDMIQCFYDVATVTGEPIRHKTLKYVEHLAHRWKYGVMQLGWKDSVAHTDEDGGAVGADTDLPSPYEVIDVIIGMYCMERVGIRHDLKAEVLDFLQSKDAYEAESYFGYDPSRCGPPDRCIEVSSGLEVSKYRSMSNSLIHSFYADRVGLSLGCKFADIFKWIPSLRPYKGPRDLPWDDYVDQCYLITHIIFTTNNWGELCLDPALYPHEYLFIRANLHVHIEQRDVHLVAEFLETLRAFGCKDEDPLIRRAMRELLSMQLTGGLWDASDDPYRTYHATMCGAQALLAHKYRGFGPGLPDVLPLLVEWTQEDIGKLEDYRIDMSAESPHRMDVNGSEDREVQDRDVESNNEISENKENEISSAGVTRANLKSTYDPKQKERSDLMVESLKSCVKLTHRHLKKMEVSSGGISGLVFPAPVALHSTDGVTSAKPSNQPVPNLPRPSAKDSTVKTVHKRKITGSPDGDRGGSGSGLEKKSKKAKDVPTGGDRIREPLSKEITGSIREGNLEQTDNPPATLASTSKTPTSVVSASRVNESMRATAASDTVSRDSGSVVHRVEVEATVRDQREDDDEEEEDEEESLVNKMEKLHKQLEEYLNLSPSVRTTSQQKELMKNLMTAMYWSFVTATERSLLDKFCVSSLESLSKEKGSKLSKILSTTATQILDSWRSTEEDEVPGKGVETGMEEEKEEPDKDVETEMEEREEPDKDVETEMEEREEPDKDVESAADEEPDKDVENGVDEEPNKDVEAGMEKEEPDEDMETGVDEEPGKDVENGVDEEPGKDVENGVDEEPGKEVERLGYNSRESLGVIEEGDGAVEAIGMGNLIASIGRDVFPESEVIDQMSGRDIKDSMVGNAKVFIDEEMEEKRDEESREESAYEGETVLNPIASEELRLEDKVAVERSMDT